MKYYTARPKFRDYQSKVSAEIDQAEIDKKSSVICQPTGTGKSIVLIDRALRKVDEGLTVAIIVPSLELVQNVEKYIFNFAPKIAKYLYSPICTGKKYRPNKRLYVSTYQSFIRKYQAMRTKPVYFIHDEAHHCKSKTWEKIAQLPGFHLAFTATPIRLDGRSLVDLFPGFIDTGKDVRWFIENDFLSDFEVKSTFSVEFEKTKGFDNLKYQSEKLDKREILGNCVEQWKKFAYGRKTVVFTTSTEHSQHVLEAYQGEGIPSAIVSHKMTKDQRDKVLEGFREGKYTVIINVSILTEGIDVPDADCVQLLRFTNSVSLYFQMIGRVLRPSANKAIILDHAGCVETHLTPDCPIDWKELYYSQVSIKEISSFNPYVNCLCCEQPIMKKSERPDYKVAKKCPHCGYENIINPPEKRAEITEKNGDLFDFKLSQSQQVIYKIVNGDKPHQEKVKLIMKMLFIYSEDDVKTGLNILYEDHPDREKMVEYRLNQGLDLKLKSDLKKAKVLK